MIILVYIFNYKKLNKFYFVLNISLETYHKLEILLDIDSDTEHNNLFAF